MESKTTVTKNFDGSIKLIIRHLIGDSYEDQEPVVEDGIKWETEFQGYPGKLTFKVYRDSSGNLNFEEGDIVLLVYTTPENKQVIIFNGYVFTKKRNKDGWIDVTAYDQLRYFKNKATYTYTNKTASQLLQMISKDFNLPIGDMDDTAYVISKRSESDQSLFDIMLNAMDDTLANTKKKYVLYSDQGKLCLRDVESLKTDLVINDVTAEDFEYSSSIDDETYNEIELYFDNDDTSRVEVYRANDPTTQKRWGILRLTEQIQTKVNATDRATKMLEIYNRKTRTLEVKQAFGDYRCRAGASVIVNLDLGDVVVSNYMLIEKATHTFKKNEYRMDLTLNGFQEDIDGIDTKGNAKVTAHNVPNTVRINVGGTKEYAGNITVIYYDLNNKRTSITKRQQTENFTVSVKPGSTIIVQVSPKTGDGGRKNGAEIIAPNGWTKHNQYEYRTEVKENTLIKINWLDKANYSNPGYPVNVKVNGNSAYAGTITIHYTDAQNNSATYIPTSDITEFTIYACPYTPVEVTVRSSSDTSGGYKISLPEFSTLSIPWATVNDNGYIARLKATATGSLYLQVTWVKR